MLLVRKFLIINCFWKIQVVRKRTLKLFTAVVLKRTNWSLVRCSTAAAVWRWLPAEKTEAGLVAADVLVVRWWLEERQLVLACQLVKTAAVCQSADSSALRICFRRSLKVLICCVDFLRL